MIALRLASTLALAGVMFGSVQLVDERTAVPLSVLVAAVALASTLTWHAARWLGRVRDHEARIKRLEDLSGIRDAPPAGEGGAKK